MAKPRGSVLDFASAFCVLFGLAIAAFAQQQPADQLPGIRPRTPQSPIVPPGQQQPPQQPAPPRAPFELAPKEQARIDQMLDVWEKHSDGVKLFKCTFKRWDYDKTFGPKVHNFLMSQRDGIIMFRAPDKGTFRETNIETYVPPKDPNDPKDKGSYAKMKDKPELKEELEHWVCDGDSIYQFQPKNKVLERTQLPPDMRGKAITEGPLPFIFGAKAATLRQRYWIRDVTPAGDQNIWLEAYPKFAQQAQDFSKVVVVLTQKDLLPFAMQIFKPGGNDRSEYAFQDLKVNDRIGDILNFDFKPPMTPLGWKYVNHPYTPPAPAAPPTADASKKPAGTEASRTSKSILRK